MNVHTFAAPTLAAVATQPSGCAVRPQQEKWMVGDQVFDSTQELVDTLQVDSSGIRAEYNLRQASQLNATPGERALGGAVGGAVAGAILAGMGVMAMNVMAAIGTVLTAGFFGGPSFIGLAVPVLASAGIGAAIGGVGGYASLDAYKEYGETVPGTIMLGAQGELFFHPYDELRNRVDLAEHAAAPVEGPEGTDCNAWWQIYPEY